MTFYFFNRKSAVHGSIQGGNWQQLARPKPSPRSRCHNQCVQSLFLPTHNQDLEIVSRAFTDRVPHAPTDNLDGPLKKFLIFFVSPKIIRQCIHFAQKKKRKSNA